MYLKCDLETYDLRDVNCKFDVILVEAPLEEYQRSVGLNREKYWNWDEVSVERSTFRYFHFIMTLINKKSLVFKLQNTFKYVLFSKLPP